jgi:hypothetical protein
LLVVFILGITGVAAALLFGSATVDNDTHGAHTVVYSATGTASVADIDYNPLRAGNGQDGRVRVTNTSLPWRKTITTSGPLNILNVSVRTGAGTVTCKITEDGKLLTTNSVSGASAMAECSAPGS